MVKHGTTSRCEARLYSSPDGTSEWGAKTGEYITWHVKETSPPTRIGDLGTTSFCGRRGAPTITVKPVVTSTYLNRVNGGRAYTSRWCHRCWMASFFHVQWSETGDINKKLLTSSCSRDTPWLFWRLQISLNMPRGSNHSVRMICSCQLNWSDTMFCLLRSTLKWALLHESPSTDGSP